MSAQVVSLFTVRPSVELTIRPIGVDEWSDRLVRASVKWLTLRRSDPVSFLAVTSSINAHCLLVEFDQNGKNPQSVSSSVEAQSTWISELLLKSVVPTLSYEDDPRGLAVISPVLKEPFQFLTMPLPSGSQKFTALVF